MITVSSQDDLFKPGDSSTLEARKIAVTATSKELCFLND